MLTQQGSRALLHEIPQVIRVLPATPTGPSHQPTTPSSTTIPFASPNPSSNPPPSQEQFSTPYARHGYPPAMFFQSPGSLPSPLRTPGQIHQEKRRRVTADFAPMKPHLPSSQPGQPPSVVFSDPQVSLMKPYTQEYPHDLESQAQAGDNHYLQSHHHHHHHHDQQGFDSHNEVSEAENQHNVLASSVHINHPFFAFPDSLQCNNDAPESDCDVNEGLSQRSLSNQLSQMTAPDDSPINVVCNELTQKFEKSTKGLKPSYQIAILRALLHHKETTQTIPLVAPITQAIEKEQKKYLEAFEECDAANEALMRLWNDLLEKYQREEAKTGAKLFA